MRLWVARLVFSLSTLCASQAFAVERYTEARITQIETGDTSVIVFLEVMSGDAPPTGNGGSNESLIKPYLFLAYSPEDIAARKHVIASALVALTAGTVMRFRWEDTTARVIIMLVRA